MVRFRSKQPLPSTSRVAVLGVAVAMSVGIPFAVLQNAARGSIEATQWVAHSEAVKSTLFEITYRLRDMEASALNAYLHSGDEVPIRNYRSTREQIGPLLQQLGALMRDNPAQQVRVGELKAVSEGRIRLFDIGVEQLEKLDQADALQNFNQAQKMFRFRDIADAMAAEELRLLGERVATAERSLRDARWLSLAALLIQFGLLGGMIYLSERAGSRRLLAEDRSRSATLRAQQIVQTIREPIALLDRGLALLMHNTAFGEFYRDGARSLIGLPLHGVGNGAWSDRALLQKLADVVPHDRELWDYELHQLGAGSDERIVMINARPMAAPDRSEPVLLLTVSDITARKRAEDAVRGLNQQLESKVAQVTEVNLELEAFSYSVSHDLRAPLRHIAGFADKLGALLGTDADARATHYLDVIGGAARRMSTLIDDLLVYSRLGRHALRMQAVDMQTLVEETRAMLLAETGERSLEWRIAPLPSVIGDENMLRQVWQNLLGNAVKYTARTDHAMIEVRGAQVGAEFVFDVLDNGPGFDMQYAGKLFGVFQRLHKQSEFPGSGIGLANVRRIVARHAGRTWAEASPGQGARFHFSLPVHPQAAPLLPPTPNEAA